jgi:hypothetical protein
MMFNISNFSTYIFRLIVCLVLLCGTAVTLTFQLVVVVQRFRFPVLRVSMLKIGFLVSVWLLFSC